MTSLQFDKVNGPAHFPTIDKLEWLVVKKTTIENPISTQRSTTRRKRQRLPSNRSIRPAPLYLRLLRSAHPRGAALIGY